ncbi:MAG TPA: tetratricopeptide repeat protein [Nitrospirota bacterium]|nr:tetratricopeptide repeat protein [Nitrospirota bacterium]
MKKLCILLLLGIFLTGCDVFDKSASGDYEAATKRWNAGEYQAAANLYLTFVKEHPYSSKADDALYWAGITQFLYLGETEKALQTLRLLLKAYPHRDMAPYAQWYIAQIYELGYSEYDRAIAEYRKAAEYENREVREKSLYSLAECLFRVGKIEEARATWIRQVSEFPKGQQSRLAYFRLGTAAFSKGELEKSEQYYRQALEQNEDKELVIKAKFALAECLELGDNLNEALTLYREIEPLYPNPESIQIKIKALEHRIAKKSY